MGTLRERAVRSISVKRVACAPFSPPEGSASKTLWTLRLPAFNASSTACLPYSHSAISLRSQRNEADSPPLLSHSPVAGIAYSPEEAVSFEELVSFGALDPAVSLFFSLLALPVEDADDEDDSLEEEDEDLRLSVMYHPEPLKITPTGCITRRIGPLPQLRHSVKGSAVIDCIFSKRVLQFLHSYSYIGIFPYSLFLFCKQGSVFNY